MPCYVLLETHLMILSVSSASHQSTIEVGPCKMKDVFDVLHAQERNS